MASLLIVAILIFAIFTILGLIRPWWVLWWSALANRRKVLRYYGSTMLILLVIWLLIR
ncbi:MAG: hypothetical protein OER04_00860 [Cyclobacteriaceae bacterium]|nr:hypothetical protein [Cyclobacteriaceae bacterium]